MKYIGWFLQYCLFVCWFNEYYSIYGLGVFNESGIIILQFFKVKCFQKVWNHRFLFQCWLFCKCNYEKLSQIFLRKISILSFIILANFSSGKIRSCLLRRSFLSLFHLFFFLSVHEVVIFWIRVEKSLVLLLLVLLIGIPLEWLSRTFPYLI